MQPGDLGSGALSPGSADLMPTCEYLAVEEKEASKSAEMFEVIRKYEASRTINLQVLQVMQWVVILTT